MREGPDKSNVQHSTQPRLAAEESETGSSAKRALKRQAGQVPLTHGAGRPEPNMPVHAPIWYRHWGLNE
jgi:hypothetical protein